jgi:ribonuclease T1
MGYTGSMKAVSLCRSIVAAGTALAFALFAPLPADARTPPAQARDVAVADLPREAQDVMAHIRAGGPFRYDRDGVVFGNREHHLPSQSRGYYHEYTVPTPGAKDRGARRIVCGGPRTTPSACYYSGDHYRTFARIRE